MTERFIPYDKMSDRLDLTAGKIAAANEALTSIAGRIESISLLVISAQKEGADRLGIDQNLCLLQSEILIAAKAVNFNDGNCFAMAQPLAGDSALQDDGVEAAAHDDQFHDGEGSAKQGVAGAGARWLMGLEGLYSLSKPSAFESNFLSFITFGATDSELSDIMQSLADALSGLSTAKTFLVYLSNSYDDRSSPDFVFSRRVRSLVDADMDGDSTRIVALETQQQLGIQSLSIANDNASIILKLLG